MLTWLGRPEEGIEWIRKAMRINPYHPERFWGHLGRAQFVARAYGDAIRSFSRITKPDHTHFAFLAAASAQMGDAGAASAYAQEVTQSRAGFHRRCLPRHASLQERVRSRASPGGTAEGGTARLKRTRAELFRQLRRREIAREIREDRRQPGIPGARERIGRRVRSTGVRCRYSRVQITFGANAFAGDR